MPLFSNGFSRRKVSLSSSSTTTHSNGGSNMGNDSFLHTENGQLPLRSRGGASSRVASSSNPILPLQVTTQSNNNNNKTATSMASSNSFLLGGMYVPDKDKKFRRSPRFRTSARGGGGGGGGSQSLDRLTAHIVNLWQRLWWTSPVVAVIVACLLVALVVYPLVTFMCRQYYRRTSKLLTFQQPRRYGCEWLATDLTLLDLMPSVRNERRNAEQRAAERYRIRQLLHRNDRFAILEALAPQWFHRDDAVMQEPVVSKDSRSGVAAPIVDVSVSERVKVPHLANRLTSIHKENQSPSTVQQNKKSDNLPSKRRLARTLQSMETIPNDSQCSITLSETDIAVTLVVQSSLDRVWILDETCARWKAPIVVVVAVKPDETNDVSRNLVGWRDKCPHLNLIVHHLEPYTTRDESSIPEHYPVNTLRNVALDAVKTSHVLTVDVDFVPSADLHEIIQSVLRQQPPNANKQAIVVPAFQRNVSPPCLTEEECKDHLRNDSTFIPSNFGELQRCYKTKDCSIFQSDVNWEGHSSTRTHDWLERKWYNRALSTTSDGQSIKSITCFESLRYEPYVVIRWCPDADQAASQSRIELDYENASNAQNNRSTDVELKARPLAPYYDERFYGYGKNKIQHISHLRMLGYTFSVLPEGFIVHNPHVESTVKQTWNNAAQQLHRDMDILYRNYLRELVDKYFATHGANVIDQCSQDHAR